MALRDFGWVSERTTVWDGLGLISYAMVFRFVRDDRCFSDHDVDRLFPAAHLGDG